MVRGSAVVAAARANGADLVWRVRANMVQPVERELLAGSQIMVTADRHRRPEPCVVRAIEHIPALRRWPHRIG